jgi:hypothetical protein
MEVGVADGSPRRFLVDGAAARDVAAAFVEARSMPDDPIVRAAYGELALQARRWFARITSSVRVVFTFGPEPYADASELREAVCNGLVEIRSAACEPDRRHPLLDPGEGGELDQFRAVHDIVSHGWLGHDFGRDGEYSAWRAERNLDKGLARWALATELHAHHSVRWTSGERASYKAVLLHPVLLRRSMRLSREASTDALPAQHVSQRAAVVGRPGMSFYLSNTEIQPTGLEALEFIDDPVTAVWVDSALDPDEGAAAVGPGSVAAEGQPEVVSHAHPDR